MSITANQVTLCRLLLLPAPVAMVYHGGQLGSQGWLLAALVVYGLLGITDAIDGELARRQGPTRLGAMLDPVVDKIFLVAAFGPLADLGVVNTGLVVVLFVRELAVTTLRSIALEEQFSFKTSRIAKIKTSVQMGGAGYILLIWLFQVDRTIMLILGVALGFAVVIPLWMLTRGRRPGWKALAGVALMLALVLVRWRSSPEQTIWAILVVAVGFTVYSGLEYAWGMRRVLAARVARRPVEALRLTALALVVPLHYLLALDRPGAPSFAILLLLAAELAVGGLDNSLAQAGIFRRSWPDLLRSGLQAVLGLALLWGLATSAGPLLSHVPAWLAVAVTLVDLTVRLKRHRQVFLNSTEPV